MTEPMHERLSWLEHHGCRILYVDLRECPTEVYLDTAQAVIEFMARQPLESVRVISDVSGSYATAKIVEATKNMSKLTRPYSLKSAVVGIDSIKRILLRAINLFSKRDIKGFLHLEDALQWIVED